MLAGTLYRAVAAVITVRRLAGIRIVVMMPVHRMLTGFVVMLMLVRRRSHRAAQAVVMAGHSVQHCSSRRVRQCHAKQQDQESAELFHRLSVASSSERRNVDYGPEF